MGIYCPESRVSFDAAFPKESGHIGFISQSGGNTDFVINEAGWRGIRFSRVISFGNACDLNECDFLEYMIEDPQTEIITMYLEGVRDSKRFVPLFKKAAREKTVVLVKGGCGGGRAPGPQQLIQLRWPATMPCGKRYAGRPTPSWSTAWKSSWT